MVLLWFGLTSRWEVSASRLTCCHSLPRKGQSPFAVVQGCGLLSLRASSFRFASIGAYVSSFIFDGCEAWLDPLPPARLHEKRPDGRRKKSARRRLGKSVSFRRRALGLSGRSAKRDGRRNHDDSGNPSGTTPLPSGLNRPDGPASSGNDKFRPRRGQGQFHACFSPLFQTRKVIDSGRVHRDPDRTISAFGGTDLSFCRAIPLKRNDPGVTRAVESFSPLFAGVHRHLGTPVVGRRRRLDLAAFGLRATGDGRGGLGRCGSFYQKLVAAAVSGPRFGRDGDVHPEPGEVPLLPVQDERLAPPGERAGIALVHP